MIESEFSYHRKLTKGVVASDINTMYVYICPSLVITAYVIAQRESKWWQTY